MRVVIEKSAAFLYNNRTHIYIPWGKSIHLQLRCAAEQIGAITIRKKGKFEQPRSTPKASTPQTPDFDLSWLDQLGEELPEKSAREPQAPEQPAAAPGSSGEEPTMLIPDLPGAEPVSHQDEPTRQIPDLHGQEFQTEESNLREEAPTMQIPNMSHGPASPAQKPSARQQAKPASKPAPKQAKKSQRPAPKTGMLLGIIAGALVLALLIYGIALKNGDTIYPNVYVAGINVGGMKREAAIEAVDEAISASYASATLKVQLPDRTISFSPEQTNVALDADEAIDEALAYGRDGNPFSAVTNYFSCRSTEHYIDLQTILNLDTEYIRNLIDEVAAEVESDPVPSEVRYDEDKGQLIVSIGYPDRDLNADGLYEVVYNAFMNSDFTPLTWDYDEVPCELVDLTPYYEKYCTEVQDAVYDEETHTIEDEVPGYGFNLEATNQQLAMAAAGREVIIQLEELEPEVTKEDLEEQMFGETLFNYSTEYVNNSNRTTNLTLACQAIDGTILNPGETFSFNNIVGERTAAKGYLPATVYSGGQSLEELGGGVCQVASTIYYCTLHLDLEQVHREPHQFAVSYVPLGMDATVYWGQIDYQFKNTLSYPIKIMANTDGGYVNITFLGSAEMENTVEMSYVILETYPWQEVEEVDETKPAGYREVEVTPYTGYKVVTYKAIYDADGKELSKVQEAVSVYSKRDKKYIIGPEQAVEDPEDPENPGETEDPVDPENPFDPVEPENSTSTDTSQTNPWA